MGYAAERRQTEVTWMLLEAAAQQAGTPYTLTPLHHAVESGELEAVKMLVEHGAELKWKDRQQRNPLRLAQQHGHTEIANFLLETATNRLEDALESF